MTKLPFYIYENIISLILNYSYSKNKSFIINNEVITYSLVCKNWFTSVSNQLSMKSSENWYELKKFIQDPSKQEQQKFKIIKLKDSIKRFNDQDEIDQFKQECVENGFKFDDQNYKSIFRSLDLSDENSINQLTSIINGKFPSNYEFEIELFPYAVDYINNQKNNFKFTPDQPETTSNKIRLVSLDGLRKSNDKDLSIILNGLNYEILNISNTINYSFYFFMEFNSPSASIPIKLRDHYIIKFNNLTKEVPEYKSSLRKVLASDQISSLLESPNKFINGISNDQTVKSLYFSHQCVTECTCFQGDDSSGSEKELLVYQILEKVLSDPLCTVKTFSFCSFLPLSDNENLTNGLINNKSINDLTVIKQDFQHLIKNILNKNQTIRNLNLSNGNSSTFDITLVEPIVNGLELLRSNEYSSKIDLYSLTFYIEVDKINCHEFLDSIINHPYPVKEFNIQLLNNQNNNLLNKQIITKYGSIINLK